MKTKGRIWIRGKKKYNKAYRKEDLYIKKGRQYGREKNRKRNKSKPNKQYYTIVKSANTAGACLSNL